MGRQTWRTSPEGKAWLKHYNKEYRATHKNKRRAQQLTPEYKAAKKVYDNAHHLLNTERKAKYQKTKRYNTETLWKRLNKAASSRGHIVTLTLSEFKGLLIQSCHYCGSALPRQGYGVDRVDNSKGYTMDNVVACCTLCNWTKGAFLSHDEMMLVAAHRSTNLGPA